MRIFLEQFAFHILPRKRTVGDFMAEEIAKWCPSLFYVPYQEIFFWYNRLKIWELRENKLAWLWTTLEKLQFLHNGAILKDYLVVLTPGWNKAFLWNWNIVDTSGALFILKIQYECAQIQCDEGARDVNNIWFPEITFFDMS